MVMAAFLFFFFFLSPCAAFSARCFSLTSTVIDVEIALVSSALQGASVSQRVRVCTRRMPVSGAHVARLNVPEVLHGLLDDLLEQYLIERAVVKGLDLGRHHARVLDKVRLRLGQEAVERRVSRPFPHAERVLGCRKV